ncbi:Man1/Src1, C-terminal [Dillenia turbinata]|uniref:Man1/Src1, C-terminal n=1 Tax=Dillenia turbinata TaxID=194707 RepID=A0AAN8ZUN3_9MAGN
MSCSPRHPKHQYKSKNPKSKPSEINNDSSSSSSSPIFQFLAMEPPDKLLPSKAELLKLLAVVAIASSVAVTCNFLLSSFTRQPKPFCDTNPASDVLISDFCEPCPEHGECKEGKLECLQGYRKHGRLCVEDGDINEMARKLSKWIEAHVCEEYVQFLCEGTGRIWVPEDEIWNDLYEDKLQENIDIDIAHHAYTKQRAMETIGKILEKRTDPNGGKELKCPDFLAKQYQPFVCYIRQWIWEHALVLVLACGLLAGCMWLVMGVRRRWYLSKRVEQLYHQVCEVLEENAMMSKSVNGEVQPWVIASWLRDHLLLPRERKDPLLWKRVESLVQEDSRVDQYPKLVKGESKVVWEWQVEGSLSSLRRRKKAESRMKSNEGVNMSYDQETHTSKNGALLKSWDSPCSGPSKLNKLPS